MGYAEVEPLDWHEFHVVPWHLWPFEVSLNHLTIVIYGHWIVIEKDLKGNVSILLWLWPFHMRRSVLMGRLWSDDLL